MQLAKSTTPKKINVLYLKTTALSVILVAFLTTLFSVQLQAQDNSPYSRYGIGDLVPSTNITSRGMGGISAGYTDFLTINFNNPASYTSFQAFKEAKSKKLASGRAILDVGLNFDNRTLTEQNNPLKFTTSNALFSHVQVGVPLTSKMGLSFGLRPISRVSYKIGFAERLFDPNTNLPIDSAYTEYNGDGGSYLASIGTGYKFVIDSNNVLSIGVNGGYFFGKKDYSTRRTISNDSIAYYRGNFQNRTTYGNIYFNAGLQYRILLDPKKKSKSLTIGLHGNLQQSLRARQDIIRETYFFDENNGNVQLDSVSIQSEIPGTVVYPASFTVGFVYEKESRIKEAGWLIGVDFIQQKWTDYRFYGQQDLLTDKWEVRVGAQLRPAPTRNYFSNVAYRAGFFVGPDYVKVQQDLPMYGASFGLGLPLPYIRGNNQVTLINLAFEYIKRGNNDNLLRENMFRFSFGMSLSDLWFIKRKYD